MLEAALFIQTIETRQGLMVSCPEEIAYRYGYISGPQLSATAASMKNNGYGQYLTQLLREKVF
jgi:glucose-1-phosphate thymidylyltransferase